MVKKNLFVNNYIFSDQIFHLVKKYDGVHLGK